MNETSRSVISFSVTSQDSQDTRHRTPIGDPARVVPTECEPDSTRGVERIARIVHLQRAEIRPDETHRNAAVRRGPAIRGVHPGGTEPELAVEKGHVEREAAPGAIYGLRSGVGPGEDVPFVGRGRLLVSVFPCRDAKKSFSASARCRRLERENQVDRIPAHQ
jgi:hypothetical protein